MGDNWYIIAKYYPRQRYDVLINNAIFLAFFTFYLKKTQNTQNHTEKIVSFQCNSVDSVFISRLLWEILEMRYRFELEEVLHMLVIDESFSLGVFALASADVMVKNRVRKA